MIAIAILYVLASLDATFCGFRAAAGRNALIDKRAYYRRAMRVAFYYGQAAIFALLGLAVLLWAISPDRAGLVDDYRKAAGAVLTIYLPYTLILVAALGLNRLVTSVDLQSILSILIFGPGTFVRPLVATVGMVHALRLVSHPAVIAVGLAGLITLLSFEWILSRPSILARLTGRVVSAGTP